MSVNVSVRVNVSVNVSLSVNVSVRADLLVWVRVCAPTRSGHTSRSPRARKTTAACVPSPRSMTWLSPKPQPTPQGRASLSWVPEQRLSPQGHCQAARSTDRSSNTPRTPRSPWLTRVTDCILASPPVSQTHTWLYLTLASHHRNDRWGAAGAGPASQLTWRTGPWAGARATQTDRQTAGALSPWQDRGRRTTTYAWGPGDHMGPSAHPTWAEDRGLDLHPRTHSWSYAWTHPRPAVTQRATQIWALWGRSPCPRAPSPTGVAVPWQGTGRQRAGYVPQAWGTRAACSCRAESLTGAGQGEAPPDCSGVPSTHLSKVLAQMAADTLSHTPRGAGRGAAGQHTHLQKQQTMPVLTRNPTS